MRIYLFILKWYGVELSHLTQHYEKKSDLTQMVNE